MTPSKRQSWSLDQVAKSAFFHEKLHQWQLLEVARQIEHVQGERLPWNLSRLEISEAAWNKTIHRGIKPVVVFAHPDVLTTVTRSTGYYRMMAMVSQKSMNQVGLPTTRYEAGSLLSPEVAEKLARHLNRIISQLIEADQQINPKEFDL